MLLFPFFGFVRFLKYAFSLSSFLNEWNIIIKIKNQNTIIKPQQQSCKHMQAAPEQAAIGQTYTKELETKGQKKRKNL